MRESAVLIGLLTLSACDRPAAPAPAPAPPAVAPVPILPNAGTVRVSSRAPGAPKEGVQAQYVKGVAGRLTYAGPKTVLEHWVEYWKDGKKSFSSHRSSSTTMQLPANFEFEFGVCRKNNVKGEPGLHLHFVHHPDGKWFSEAVSEGALRILR